MRHSSDMRCFLGNTKQGSMQHVQNLVPNSCMILVQDCKWPAVSQLPGNTFISLKDQ